MRCDLFENEVAALLVMNYETFFERCLDHFLPGKDGEPGERHNFPLGCVPDVRWQEAAAEKVVQKRYELVPTPFLVISERNNGRCAMDPSRPLKRFNGWRAAPTGRPEIPSFARNTELLRMYNQFCPVGFRRAFNVLRQY